MITIYNDFINTYKIQPKKISSYEVAWKIKDTETILKWLGNNNHVVLGGDILDLQGNYACDNWFYNYNYDVPLIDNVNASVTVAQKYLSDYMTNNGDNYYVIIIIK